MIKITTPHNSNDNSDYEGSKSDMNLISSHTKHLEDNDVASRTSANFNTYNVNVNQNIKSTEVITKDLDAVKGIHTPLFKCIVDFFVRMACKQSILNYTSI